MLWLNILFMAVVFIAIVGGSIWLVLSSPDEKPQDARQPSARTSQPSAARPHRQREPQLTH